MTVDKGGRTVLPNTRIIACSVFKPALDFLGIEQRYPEVCITFLPSNLHLKPVELKQKLLEEVISAKRRGERIVCVYGDCFPGIEDFCTNQGITKAAGFHCFEMLLGSEKYQRTMNEEAGTYFVEKDLIQNFHSYCMEPLELFDETMRKLFFERYQRIVYVRQPTDPDLGRTVAELAEFLHLALEVKDADYTHLERVIGELM